MNVVVERLAVLILLLPMAGLVIADGAAIAERRQSIVHSYGTYDGDLRTPQGRIDQARLLAELGELHANSYNWLIAHAATDWDDLHTFLPLARKKGIRIWVTLLPPSESPPRTKYYSEPFRLDFTKWAAELAALSVREPALVAWSVDDFAYNLKTAFTPERMRAIIAAQRERIQSLPSFPACTTNKRRQPSPKTTMSFSTESYFRIAANRQPPALATRHRSTRKSERSKTVSAQISRSLSIFTPPATAG